MEDTSSANQNGSNYEPYLNSEGLWVFDKHASWSNTSAIRRKQLRQHYIATSGLVIDGIANPCSLRSEDPGLVLTLPWIAGIDLQRYFSQTIENHPEPCLASTEVCQVGLAISELLVKLEHYQLVHCALEPEHILIEPQTHRLYIISFGSSRYTNAISTSPGTSELDLYADLYAMGRLLVWLATGKHIAFQSLTHRKTAAQVLKPEVVAHLPPALVSIIIRLLNAGWDNGYRSARAVTEDLKFCTTGQVWRRHNDLGAPQTMHIPSQRIGRNQLVQQLLEAFDDVAPLLTNDSNLKRAGTHSNAILFFVGGFSGIGKTLLVLSACSVMKRHGGKIAYGKFNQFGDSRPMWALAQALDSIISELINEASTDHINTLIDRIRFALGQLAGVLLPFLPQLQLLLGEDLPPPPPVWGEASKIRFELMLHRFIAALATPSSPLVIFLDDLQWADPASLDMLYSIVQTSSIQNVLIIGAYRSEEVTHTHPLATFIANVVHDQADYRQLTVEGISQNEIADLLRHIGIHDEKNKQHLSELLFQITHGNPFAVLQALRCTQLTGAIRFDKSRQNWQVDMETARGLLADTKPIHLVEQQIRTMPITCQQVLATSSLLGAVFDIEALATASRLSVTDTLTRLQPALAQGLVMLADIDATPKSPLTLRSAHDIVQQAANALIAQSEREDHHLLIGRALLDCYQGAGRLDQHVFEVIQQFQHSNNKQISDRERALLVFLNVSAARKTRESGAKLKAFEHFQSALELMQGFTVINTEQHFETLLEAAESAYLAAQFDALDRLLQQLNHTPRPTVDSVRVDELHIQGLLARNRLSEALEIGIRALNKLDVSLVDLLPPEHWPSIPSLNEVNPLPFENNRINIALQVLVWLTPCAYITSFEMYARVILTMVTISKQNPTASLSPLVYANYGLTLCSGGNYDQGVAAGQLALALCERQQDEPLRCKVWTLVYGFVLHWKSSCHQSVSPLLKTLEDCLLCGDQEYLGYAAFLYCDKAWEVSKLPELEKIHLRHTQLVKQFGHAFSWRHCLVWLQMFDALRNPSGELKLCGEWFDADHDIAALRSANNQFSMFTAHTLMAFLAWHRHDYDDARRNCEQAERYAMVIPPF